MKQALGPGREKWDAMRQSSWTRRVACVEYNHCPWNSRVHTVVETRLKLLKYRPLFGGFLSGILACIAIFAAYQW
ncbi:MAG TPA: hypothetical protein VGL71_06020, partial [Urbifossiella sp.]